MTRQNLCERNGRSAFNNDVKKLIENASGYGYLMQEHIYKEDNILYPMAEEGLNDEQKQRVEESYQKVNTGDFLNKDINAFIENLIQNKNK
ncbi:MAG: hypothetical protein IPF54_24460 [Draconibacterium sp.]|nr:hypothetical protein [Draconibacterium sp.]